MDKENVTIQSNSSIDRALSLLEVVASRVGGITLADIVKEMDIPKTTAFRMLDVLKQRGYVAWEPNGEKYSIGLKMLETGVSGLIRIEVVDAAIPYLADITQTTGETSFLAAFNEGEVVYLYKIESSNSIRTSAQLGARRPAHCSGLGKAILSALSLEEVDRIIEVKGLERKTANTITNRLQLHEELSLSRVRGYAVDNEEGEEGLTCYAVPIFNYSGRVVGAISCAGPTKRVISNNEFILEKVMESGSQISRRLGFVPSMRSRT